MLKAHGIRISMDGKGAWRDNVFVERLWRSVKYEEVYLNAYDSMRHARLTYRKMGEFLQSRTQTSDAQSHAEPEIGYRLWAEKSSVI